MKRLVSVILVFIMMLGCFPLHAAAASAATVTTLEPEDTRATSVKMVGTFETLLSEVVTEYGFEYYEVKKTGAKNITAVPVETGVKISSYNRMEHRYSLVIDGLKQNTKYVGRAYIKLKSSKTPLRGKDFTFTTVETKPTIRLMSSSCSSDGSFHAKGFVTSKVTDGIVEYGFAYGTSADTPVKYPLAVSDGAALVLSRKEFTATVKGLEPGTEYYVRAYAARSDGKTDYSASAGKLTTKDYTAALKLDADHITATEDPNYVRGMGITYRYDKSFYSIGSVALNYRYGDLPYTSVEMKKQTGSSSYRASIGKLLGGERYEYYLTVTSDAGTEYDSPVFSFEPEIILADSLEVWISHGISTRKAKSETFDLNTKAKVQARISPANADDGQVRWVSSDESVAYVEDGYVVCAGAGKATITAFTEYRGEKNLSYSFNVTVRPEAAYGPGPVITGGISVTDSTVSLSWKRPADFWSTDKVVYIFERADGKEGPYRSFGTATASTSMTLHNLDPETHYYFRFIAQLKGDADYRKFSDWTYFEAITAEETAKKKERVSKQSGSTDVISVVPDKTVASTADVITYTVTTGTGVNGGVRLECGGYGIGEIAAKDKRASTSTQNVYKPTSRFTSGGAKEVRAYALDENGEPIRTENKYAVCVVNINADGKVDMVGSLNANAGAAGEDVAVSFSKPANVSSGKVFYNIYVIAPDGGRICAKDFYESSAKSVSCAVDGAFFPSAGTYKIEVYAIVNGRNNSDGQGISVTVKSGAPAGSGQEGSVPAEPEKNVKPLVTGLESSYTAVVGVPLDLSFTVTDPAGGKVEKVTVKNNTKGGEVIGSFEGSGKNTLKCKMAPAFSTEGDFTLIVYGRTENYTITENIVATTQIHVSARMNENQGSGSVESGSADEQKGEQGIPAVDQEDDKEEYAFETVDGNELIKKRVEDYISKRKKSGLLGIGLGNNGYTLGANIINEKLRGPISSALLSVLNNSVDTNLKNSWNSFFEYLGFSKNMEKEFYKSIIYKILDNCVEDVDFDTIYNSEMAKETKEGFKKSYDNIKTLNKVNKYTKYGNQAVLSTLSVFPEAMSILRAYYTKIGGKLEPEKTDGEIIGFLNSNPFGKTVSTILGVNGDIWSIIYPMIESMCILKKTNNYTIEAIRNALNKCQWNGSDDEKVRDALMDALDEIEVAYNNSMKADIIQLLNLCVEKYEEKMLENILKSVLGKLWAKVKLVDFIRGEFLSISGYKNYIESTNNYYALAPVVGCIDAYYWDLYKKITNGTAESDDYLFFCELTGIEAGCQVIVNTIASDLSGYGFDQYILEKESEHIKNHPISKWEMNPYDKLTNFGKPNTADVDDYYFGVMVNGISGSRNVSKVYNE